MPLVNRHDLPPLPQAAGENSEMWRIEYMQAEMVNVLCEEESAARSIFEALADRLPLLPRVVLDELVEELKPDVEQINRMPTLTQYSYGRWMMFLSDKDSNRTTVATALVLAGADARGVLWALKCLGTI